VSHRRLVDVRDSDQLSDALLQVLYFSEHVNSTVHSWFLQHRDSLRPAGRTALPHLRTVLEQARASFHHRSGSLPARHSDLIALARKIGFQFQPNLDLIDRLIDSLLGPLTAGARRRIPAAQKLKEEVFVYPLASGGLSFATRPILGSRGLHEEVSLLFWDETLNPIFVLQAFLMEVLKEDIYSADHYIQGWIRHLFDLPYRRELKYILGRVCDRFNDIFYGSLSPSHQQFHTKRSATLGTSLLVSEVARILGEEQAPEAHELSFPENKTNIRRALGIFLFFRFCRQLEARHQLLDLKPDGSRSLQSEDLATLEAGVNHGQCVRAIRPLQPTYFQTRMFGALSGIPGLNDIFRGGFLPRASSGQTFTIIGDSGAGKTVLALQMLCDVARQGRLAVYFSFEESYESIVDRLNTFHFHDPEKFTILAAGPHDPGLAAGLREAALARPRRGLLVLYGGNEGAGDAEDFAGGIEAARRGEHTYSLPAAIREIAAAADEWKWRALAIDSINAIDFGPSPDEPRRRLVLQELIQVIETQRFLGLILSEQGNSDFDVLTYLSDAAMELGVDEENKTRWLRPKKCRTQDYQPGRHPFRIADGRGVVIYPSLSARMSSLRRRMRTTLSEHQSILFPIDWRDPLGLPGLREKSSTLIWGSAGAGKTALMLQLATMPSQAFPDPPETLQQRPERPEPPYSVLLITFRTSEANVLHSLQHHKALFDNWKAIHRTRLRWYSPGDNLTGDQIIGELWSYIHEGRRAGLPIERILFDETEMAEESLPALKREPLFWPTLLELVATEAITSFFVSGSENRGSRVFEWLSSTVDYILHAERDKSGRHWLEVEKSPELWAGLSRQMEIQLDSKTGLIDRTEPQPE
jgi:KaiC/GvpD/RAD55 family RecA-like ATPase